MQTSAKISAALIAGAVLLNILPWFGGPGWIWSALLLGGAAWIWIGRAQPSHLVLWALVACAHALDNFYIGVGSLPWLVGAWFSLRTIAGHFDLSKIKRGYAPYAIIGALLCLWTPFWTWGDVPGWSGSSFMGGLDYNSHLGSDGYFHGSLDYNATKYLMPFYYPGWDYTGRALAGSFNASLVALSLLGWTLWRDETNRHLTRLLPVAGALMLLIWVAPALRSGYSGPFVFLAGALGTAFCAFMALRGKQSGAFDGPDVAARVQSEVAKRRAPR